MNHSRTASEPQNKPHVNRKCTACEQQMCRLVAPGHAQGHEAACKALREHSAGGSRSQTEQGAHGCGPPDLCVSRFFCCWLLFLWLRSVCSWWEKQRLASKVKNVEHRTCASSTCAVSLLSATFPSAGTHPARSFLPKKGSSQCSRAPKQQTGEALIRAHGSGFESWDKHRISGTR
eukprot:gene10124-biopygen19781